MAGFGTRRGGGVGAALAVLAGAVAVVLAVMWFGGRIATGDRPDATVTIRSPVSAKAAPDVAVISAGVEASASSASTAADLAAQRASKVLEAARKSGVDGKDLKTLSATVAPQYTTPARGEPRISGYVAGQLVQVTVRDTARMGALMSALTGAGAQTIQGPEFRLEDPETAMADARRAAIEAAELRAQLYADAAGFKRVRILRISEADPEPGPPAPPAMLAMDAGAPEGARGVEDTPIAPGEVALEDILIITYALDR